MALSIKTKTLGTIMGLGLVPAGLVMGMFLYVRGDFVRGANDRLSDSVQAVSDKIDRNLFERYSDVQAFGANTLLQDPANWRAPSAENPLVKTLNTYMSLYGIYDITLFVDPQGRTLAVNSQNAKGEAIATAGFYGKSFAGEDWFKQVSAGKYLAGTNGLTGTTIVGPHKDELIKTLNGDGRVLVFAAPVKDKNGALIGYFANYARFALVEQIIGQSYQSLAAAELSSARMILLDETGRMLTDYDPKRGSGDAGFDIAGFGKPVEGEAMGLVQVAGESDHGSANVAEDVMAWDKSSGAYDYPGLGWRLILGVDKAEALGPVSKAIDLMLAAVMAVLGSMVVIGWLLSNKLTKGLMQHIESIDALSQGKPIAVTGLERGDELGRLAQAMNRLRDKVAAAFRLQTMVEAMPLPVVTLSRDSGLPVTWGNTAANDLFARLKMPGFTGRGLSQLDAGFTKGVVAAESGHLPHKQRIPVGAEVLDTEWAPITDGEGRQSGVMVTLSVATSQETMARAFERDVQSVVKTVSATSGELRSESARLAEVASETNAKAAIVAAAAEEATVTAQTVAASAEELNASISEISAQVHKSSMIARTAVDKATDASKTVSQLVDQARTIGDVIKLIMDIAGQTNLLALNATIEAARAGESGKGFAVVAGEVKALANQTARASEQIAQQITQIQGATDETVEAINAITATIEAINQTTAAISAAVEEQSAATSEIARNVTQTAAGTSEITNNIHSVTEAANSTGHAAETMLAKCMTLTSDADRLDHQVAGFLASVRAG